MTRSDVFAEQLQSALTGIHKYGEMCEQHQIQCNVDNTFVKLQCFISD